MVISRIEGTYFSECEYVDTNIHVALKRYDELDKLMKILCDDNKECAYKLTFKVEGKKCINNVKIYPSYESNGVSHTSDTFEHEVAKDSDRGNS